MLTPEPGQAKEQDRLIPLSEWNKFHPDPTKGTLYQYKFHNTRNFANECLEPGGANGKRLLINEKKYFEWHEKNKHLLA